MHKYENIQGQGHWYPMKGLATENTYVKYGSPSPNRLNVMVKVKKNLKVGQTPRSKVLLSNERFCHKDLICKV